MRNKDIIIQKANKDNTVVITNKDKYIEGVKRAISDSNKFVQLNITPDKYLNYIINVEKKFKQLFKDLLDNDKISKDEYDKICPKDQEYFMAILKSINQLLITCQNLTNFVCYKYPWIQFSYVFDTYTITTYS